MREIGEARCEELGAETPNGEGDEEPIGELLAKPEVLMAGTGLGSRDKGPPHGMCPGGLAGLPEETEKFVPLSLRRGTCATPCGELL